MFQDRHPKSALQVGLPKSAGQFLNNVCEKVSQTQKALLSALLTRVVASGVCYWTAQWCLHRVVGVEGRQEMAEEASQC